MKKLLFVITQFYKGGAEVALLNLFKALSPEDYDIDFLIFDQVELSSAVSLIPQVPKWINTFNAAQNEGKIAFVKKAISKIYQKMTGKQLYRQSAYDFVKNKIYDCAFSYGEWLSPEFVATKVKSKHKYVWIHADIDKAQYIDERVLFHYDNAYQKYIFVSNISMQKAVEKYPFLNGRTCVIHNICDDESILVKSKEDLLHSIVKDRPVLLTVANFRMEKNHLRQIEAMHLLKEKGISFLWLNIGCNVDLILMQQMKFLINKYNLQNDFIILDADPNPYKYMIHADAVTALSNFEAWSLVITEAKLLGIPVIATKTSGALEQIEDGKTGLLCDFDVQDIADKIEYFLSNKDIQNEIKKNLSGFSTRNNTLKEWEQLIE